MFPVTISTPILKLGPSITDVSFVRCPLLHLLPWLDTSCAAVIGPRSYGLCWWSQRVRKAGGRVVPVHHPVKDSLPRRSFVEQPTHIIAAWVRPTERERERASERPEQAGSPVPSTAHTKPPWSCAMSRINVELSPSRVIWLISVHLPSWRAVQALHGFTYPCWFISQDAPQTLAGSL